MKRLLIVTLSVAALFVAQTAGISAQAKAKTASVSGSVKSVSGSSLVITAAGNKDMTFSVDNTTKFVGKGLSTKSQKGPITAADAVGAGDKVRVTYHDMGGTLHAANVSITAKAVPAKK